jgi:hypothetical protein
MDRPSVRANEASSWFHLLHRPLSRGACLDSDGAFWPFSGTPTSRHIQPKRRSGAHRAYSANRKDSKGWAYSRSQFGSETVLLGRPNRPNGARQRLRLLRNRSSPPVDPRRQPGNEEQIKPVAGPRNHQYRHSRERSSGSVSFWSLSDGLPLDPAKNRAQFAV